MRILHLACLVLTLLFFACGEKDATAFDPAAQVWEFSLSNPLPVVSKLKAPRNLPFSSRLRRQVLGPGDVLRVEGDTAIVENDLRVSFSGLPRKFLLFTTDDHPDSLAGFKLSQGVGTTLNIAYYHGDTLREEWMFEPKKETLREIAFGELDEQTYRCAFPGGDTMQVYFGTSLLTYGRDEGKKYEYVVTENPDFREERSCLQPGRFRYWGRRMVSMRGDVFFGMAREGFSSKRYTFGRNENGTVIASYFEVENGRYERVNMPLVLLAPISADFSEADFADRLNSGRVLADDTYPRIDSARVSYLYQKDYKGIDYNELSELEFSAEPGGEFIVVVRDRLLQNNGWRLSPDGRYLITLDKSGREYGHYPILAYTDGYIDLRMPFSVKTREPRGVALESYANLDVFIRIARREGATSR